jgi:fatty-acyl-CoA synthase
MTTTSSCRPPSSSSSRTATVTEEEIIAFCAGKIATFRVPRYVRFVTEWPMSGTKIKKAILREMIAADLKEKGTTRAAKISTA